MFGRRRRVLRAAVLGLLGVVAAAPAAHAATCVRNGGLGTAVLTFVAADGTVTLAQDGTTLTFAVGAGAAQPCTGVTLANIPNGVTVNGSAAADTLVLDVTAGPIVDSAGVQFPIDVDLVAASDTISVRLPDDDSTVTGGTLGVDLDGDASPDLTFTNTERLTVTGGAGADDLEFGGDGLLLGTALNIPVTLSGGDGDDTLRGGAAGDSFAGGAGEDVVTYDDRSAAVSAGLNGAADDGASGEGDLIGTDVEDLTGGAGNDTLTGDLRGNVLAGGAGNDVVTGGRGDDTLTGGPGNDTVSAGAGDDTLDEAAPADGTDVLAGGDGSDTVDYSGRTAGVTVTLDGKNTSGQAGEGDTVGADVEGATGGGGADTLVGASADDTFDGGAGADVISGGAGADTLTGGIGNDNLNGGPGDDTIDPGAGDDNVTGGLGDDEIDQPGAPLGLDDVADGSDVIDGGGGGFDTASYAGRTLPVALSLDGVKNDGQAGELDNLIAIDDIAGGQANDVLQGGPGDDTITPGPGDDTVSGGAGEDAVDYSDRSQPVTIVLGAPGVGGGLGEHDTIAADVEDATGGNGNDLITGGGGDNYLVGGAGNDVIGGAGGDDDLDPGDGSDQLDGGTGEDTADYSTVSHGVDLPGVDANLATGVATSFDANGDLGSDKLTGFEDLLGSDFADTLTGDSRANTLDGGLRDDALNGGGGSDELRGGAGDDTLSGAAGADKVDGGDGADTLKGGDGADELNGGADDDTLTGGNQADRLVGAAGDDTLTAGNGDDALLGGAGDDTESGGAGRDRFDQGQAADGADRLDGGGGTDTVDYRGRHAKLTVTVGGGANDGEKGEGDNVVKTIEIVFGGAGADKLTAGVKAAVLHGSGGADVLIGGKGKDYLDGGEASDTAKRVGRGDRVVSCRIV
jgi:Ca2+-binding RTX toxin-like protein